MGGPKRVRGVDFINPLQENGGAIRRKVEVATWELREGSVTVEPMQARKATLGPMTGAADFALLIAAFLRPDW
jgi:hypothetical protein